MCFISKHKNIKKIKGNNHCDVNKCIELVANNYNNCWQSMTSSDGFNVRFATASDYKAVLDINRNVYEGFDYLPSLYFYFLHHPDVFLFVAELNGKIVSIRSHITCIRIIPEHVCLCHICLLVASWRTIACFYRTCNKVHVPTSVQVHTGDQAFSSTVTVFFCLRLQHVARYHAEILCELHSHVSASFDDVILHVGWIQRLLFD